MNDVGLVVVAAAVAASALVAAPAPGALAWMLVVLGGAVAVLLGREDRDDPGHRRRVHVAVAAVAVGLCLLVSARAHESLEALGAPLPSRVEGAALLVTDPEAQRFGVQFVVRLDGRRYQARVAPDAAGAVRGLLAGEQVHLRGRTSELRGAPPGWVRSRHLAGALTVESVRPTGDAAPWFRIANGIHRTLTAGATPLGQERAALYTGLVMGDDRAQSELTRFRFRAAGLSHLLAVSGQNVAFVLAVAAPLLRRLGPRGALVAAVALLGVVVLVTRAEPSVLRAATMAALALLAVHRGRLASGVRLVASTVVVLLLADPLLVHSVGFQLSVAATLGLLLLARPITDRLPGPPWLTFPLGVTLAAQLATAPLLLALNGGLPLVATPANLLAVPVAGLVMMWGVSVGALAGLVRAPVAEVLQWPVGWCVGWIDGVAAVATRAPLPILGPTRLGALGLVTAVGLGMRRFLTTRRRRLLLVLLLPVVVVALRPASPPEGISALAGARLVVGECGGVAVELGSSPHDGELLDALWDLGVRRLDLVVAGPRRTSFAVAETLRRQFGARRVVTTSTRPPPGVDTVGDRTLAVGGLVVAARDGPAATQDGGSGGLLRPSGAPCSFWGR